MGFFSKLWKGIKKTFKKIFKPIKKVFKSIGKFMGKIGIVGQIAMSFLLPGIGTALAGAFGNVVGGLAGGALGSVGKAAGWVLGKAGEFAKMAYQGYKTVSGAVTDFIGTTGKYVGGKLGITKEMTLKQAFGSEGWGGRLTDSFSKMGDAAKEFFDTDIKGVLPKPTNVPGTGVLKQEELAKQPSLDPASEYQQAMQKELDYISDPISNQRSAFTPLETLDPNVYDASKAVAMQGKGPLRLDAAISSGIVDSTVSSETSRAGQSLLSRGLEKLTGEKTLAGAGTKAAGKFGDYLMEAPGKAVASTVTTGLGQAVGVLPKPMGDPGAPFGSQPFQEYYARSSMAFDQARQDIFGFNSDPTPYQGFVANNAVMGDPQGSFLGTAFWQDQLKARLG